MSETQTQLPTDTWIYASWQEYEQAIANLLNEKAKSYYWMTWVQSNVWRQAASLRDDPRTRLRSMKI